MIDYGPRGDDGFVTLPDGRQIGYRRFGAAHGSVVIALHGTPGSRLKFSSMDKDARRLGLQVIAPDRWGYGLTSVPREQSLKLFAADLADFANALQVGRFAIIGVSGGGPYAAAVAALLGSRVSALGLVSPVGPVISAGGPPTMNSFHRFCFLTLPDLPKVTGAVFKLFRFGLRTIPKSSMKIAMARAARADKNIMAREDVRNRLTATFIEGLRPGVQGPIIDLKLIGRDWDVPLKSIKAKTKLWIGSEDCNVPVHAAKLLGDEIATCDFTKLPGEGHLWVAINYAAVLEWLDQAMARK